MEQKKPLDHLESQAIDYIRLVAQLSKRPLFLAYSGGKDSDVLYHLFQKAKVEYTPFYNNTTIDPPGTIKHVLEKGNVMIMQPRRGFFELIRHRGLPSTFSRFCCNKLKERYVAPIVFTGVRVEESQRRKEKYKEPEICFTDGKSKKWLQHMPILNWTNEDVAQYITQERIKCHPHYYDAQGNFCVRCRIGCMGCPLPSDRGLYWFRKYPRLVRAWCTALAYYRNTRPELGTSILNYRDEYENFYHNIFIRKLANLKQMQQIEHRFFAYERLQELFQIELPPPSSTIEELLKHRRIKKAPNPA